MCCDFDASGELLAAGTTNGAITVSKGGRDHCHLCDKPLEVSSCGYTPNVCVFSLHVQVFQSDSGAQLYKLYSPDFEHLPVTSVRFMKGGNVDKRSILMAACKVPSYLHTTV